MRPSTATVPALDGRGAPDRDVPALVVAVAGLRVDVRAGQRDLAVGRNGQPGRCVELGAQVADVDPRLDRDADRVAGVVDPGQDLIRVGRELLEAGPRVKFGCAAHHAASVPTVVTAGAACVAVRPVQDTARRDLDQRPLEEERQRDACLEEVDDRRLLLLPDREEPLPAAVGVLLDDPGVALDRRPIDGAADESGSVIDSETLGLPRMCSSLRLNSADDVR